ncbi:MAG: lysylphosphatidylglycerol synthase transmembrane domain-containing protein [Pseudomonadota bacterium]
MPFKNKAFVYFFVKLVVSIILVRWLINNVDSVAMIKTFKTFSWQTFAAAFASLWCSYILGAWRWRCILLKRENGTFRFKDSLLIVAIGNFLNQGLPGSVGGDVYRGFALTRLGFSRTWAIQSLILDRIIGLFFMGLMGVLSLFSFDVAFLSQKELFPMYAVLFSICLGFSLFCQLDRLPLTGKIQKLVAPIQTMAVISRQLFHVQNMPFILVGFALTFFLYLPVYLFACELGYQLSLAAVLFVLPTVFLLSFLPISFAGWGVREVAFVSLFKFFGLPSEQALSLSVAYGLVSLLAVMPGVLLYFFDGKKAGVSVRG